MFIEMKNINKKFGSYTAANNINFSLEEGKLIGLLGPSGSGKTTILRMIAGLETPDSGDIIIGGKSVNNIHPGKRGIGFVFQSYALFQHMSVFENIAFGLRVEKADKKYINERVTELIELIGLKGLEKRLPHELSGGQRQRVAFARAIAPNPKLLLLDEPFAAIDAKVRKELRTWLKEMILKLGITSIFVTHDQDEAIEVADQIIILNKGQIEQVGTPLEIYTAPQSAFVTEFIGESMVLDDNVTLKGFDIDSKNNKYVIRPEFLEISKENEEVLLRSATETAVVKSILFRGNTYEIELDLRGQILRGYRSIEANSISVGEKVLVLINRLYVINGNNGYMIENKLKFDPMPVYI